MVFGSSRLFLLTFFVIHAALWGIVPTYRLLAEEPGIPYQVRFEGEMNGRIGDELKSVSSTVSLRNRPPASIALLRRRADKDLPDFIRVLRGYGFYRAGVSVKIEERRRPVRVTFTVLTGPPFLLKVVQIRSSMSGETVGGYLFETKGLGLKPGEPAKSRRIFDAKKEVALRWKKQGFPFVRVAETVTVSHETETVDVIFDVESGPRLRLGDIHFTGLNGIEESFLLKKRTWTRNDYFSPILISEYQRRLSETDLFSTIQTNLPDHPDSNGLLPVEIEVHERKHRTLGLGGSYRSNEGVGSKVRWEHRNLFRRGEHLSLVATISEIELSGEAIFRKPDVWHLDQSIVLDLNGGEDRTEAFVSRSLNGSVYLERLLSRELMVAGGLSYRLSDVEQLDERNSFRLFSLPAKLSWDSRDDPLDPTGGGRVNLRVTPFFDIFDTDARFWKWSVSATRYVCLSKRPQLVIAGRTGIGFILGAERDEIPADERFYAGGGGSIRGYPYQSVGPLEGENPVGGRSLFEISTELRLKLTDKFGLVGILDGGSAFVSRFPDFEEEFLWSAGAGLRYFTGIGPFRLDFAFPFERRDRIDDAFQVYVSLGQSY
jgi:translocation and assembly module TamA